MNPLACLAKSLKMVKPRWLVLGGSKGVGAAGRGGPEPHTPAGPVPWVWMWGDWDSVQRQNFWAVANCLMSFSVIGEDHARVIPASGKGSKGKGKCSSLCHFLTPVLLPNDASAGLGREVPAPGNVGSPKAFLRGTEWGFLPEYCPQGRIKDISNFSVVMCYLRFIHLLV